MDDKERIEKLKQNLTEIAEKEGKEIVFVEDEKPEEPILPPNIDDFPLYHMPPFYENPFAPKALTGHEKRRERRAKERELKRKKK
jgi:hypothetical protein